MHLQLSPNPLDERRKLVVHLRDVERLTLRAIGERIGVSGERARTIYNDAMRRLRWFEARPMGGLAALPWWIREPLLGLGFRSLSEVQMSMELGHLAWRKEQAQVCWKRKPIGNAGWETWLLLHERMGFPPPEPPAPEDECRPSLWRIFRSPDDGDDGPERGTT